MTPIKVALLPSDSNGCGWYRILQPFNLLQLAGHVDCTVRRIHQTGQFCLSPDDIAGADVVLIQRQGGKSAGMSMMDLVREHGHKIVYEIDDDVGSLTKENPAYREIMCNDPTWWNRANGIMKGCACVVVTTPHLADRMRKYNPNVRVVPNGVDLALWRGDGWQRKIGKPGAPVRVGYVASRHHVEDARLLLKPWRAIIREFPDVTFVLAGALFPCLKEALGDRLEFHNGVPLAEFPEWCRSLDLDVAVAPLVDSVFARSKSNLKFLEATALGVPMVASDVEPYKIADGPMLASNGREFGAHLASLCHPVDGPSVRAAVWERSESVVNRSWLAQHQADAWLSALREVAGDRESSTTSTDLSREAGTWRDNLQPGSHQ